MDLVVEYSTNGGNGVNGGYGSNGEMMWMVGIQQMEETM